MQELDHFLTLERNSRRDPVDTRKLKRQLLGVNNVVPGEQAEINLIEACEAASRIYKLLPNATLSTQILSQQLCGAKWIPKKQKGELLLSRT